MFKLFVLAAILAVAVAKPEPSGLLAAPAVVSAYGAAPLAYSAGYAAAPLAYSAGYAVPSAYAYNSGIVRSPLAYSAYSAYPTAYLG